MKLRRTPAEEPVLSETVEDSADEPWGKGRATPKRRDTAPKRQPMNAPRTQKEASQWRKAQVAQTKSPTKRGANMSGRQYRDAVRRGDATALGPRDRGPVRALARDWVDSRRMASNYLLYLLVVMIAGIVVPALSLISLAIFVGFFVEWYLAGRRIRALALARIGEVREGTMVLGFYAGSRAYMPRRWRLPAPRVSLGDPI